MDFTSFSADIVFICVLTSFLQTAIIWVKLSKKNLQVCYLTHGERSSAEEALAHTQHFWSQKPTQTVLCLHWLNPTTYSTQIPKLHCKLNPIEMVSKKNMFINYCTISNCSAGHGSRAPLMAPKLVTVTGHIVLGQPWHRYLSITGWPIDSTPVSLGTIWCNEYDSSPLWKRNWTVCLPMIVPKETGSTLP